MLLIWAHIDTYIFLVAFKEERRRRGGGGGVTILNCYLISTGLGGFLKNARIPLRSMKVTVGF